VCCRVLQLLQSKITTRVTTHNKPTIQAICCSVVYHPAACCSILQLLQSATWNRITTIHTPTLQTIGYKILQGAAFVEREITARATKHDSRRTCNTCYILQRLAASCSGCSHRLKVASWQMTHQQHKLYVAACCNVLQWVQSSTKTCVRTDGTATNEAVSCVTSGVQSCVTKALQSL